MGTVVASAIIADARRLLQDESNVVQRWTDAVLLAALNEAQLMVATLQPTASAATAVVTLDAKARQSLPADALSFLRVTTNLANDGVTPTVVVTPATVEELDMTNPLWRTAMPGVNVVLRAAPDPSDVYAYYVSPPVSGGKIELQYAKVPVTIATTSATITLHDRFRTALTHFVVYKAFEQDGEAPANQSLAASHQQKFFALVMGADPERTRGEATPKKTLDQGAR